MTPLASPNGIDGSLTIHQDATMYRVQLEAGETLALETDNRPGYLHVIDGTVTANEIEAGDGDGIAAYEESLSLTAGDEGMTALWFDLPKTH